MTKRIMVFNDHQSTLNMYKTVLEFEGYHTFTYKQSSVSQADIDAVKPHLFILDWTVGAERRGFDLIQQIKTSSGEAASPIIVCTVSEERKLAPYQTAFQKYDVSLLYKPFEMPDLFLLIELKTVDS